MSQQHAWQTFKDGAFGAVLMGGLLVMQGDALLTVESICFMACAGGVFALGAWLFERSSR